MNRAFLILPAALLASLALLSRAAQAAEPLPDAASAEADRVFTRYELDYAGVALARALAESEEIEAPGSLDEASAMMKQAESSYLAGDYAQASEKANAAWKLATDARRTIKGLDKTNAVQIAVDGESGATEIVAARGGLTVEAKGRNVSVGEGQKLTLEKETLLPPASISKGGGAGELNAFLSASDRLPAPRPIGPEGEMKAGGGIEFRWAAVKSAKAYEIEISEGAAPGGPRVERVEGRESFAPAPPLKAGLYEWRVRAVDAQGNAGAYSRAASLKIEPEGLQLKSIGPPIFKNAD